ncbi:hypothetical protein [Mycobacterium haemophilum]|nr:hypothetical protein [Mycobacterium haemophilum]
MVLIKKQESKEQGVTDVEVVFPAALALTVRCRDLLEHSLA